MTDSDLDGSTEPGSRRNDAAVVAVNMCVGLLVAFGVAAIALAAWSLAHGGIGWDARFDTVAAIETRSIPSGSSLEEAYESVTGNSELYGVLVQQAAEVLHLVVTGSWQTLQPDDPATYAYQGAATLILAVVAVSALALVLGIALRSPLAGAFVWSATLSTPLWLGMSHVDFKDVPVAAGLTLTTAGLVASVSVTPPRRATVVGAPLVTVGVATAMMTRAGSAVLVAALIGGTLVCVVVLVLVGRRLGRLGNLRVLPMLIAAGCAVVGSVVAVLVTNPIARIDLVTWLSDATAVAASFPSVLIVRTAGRELPSEDLPWWYVPSWLGAQLPLLTIAAILAGVGIVLAASWSRRRTVEARVVALGVPLAIQAVVLPVAIVVGGAVLYDGIRHLLFLLPALLAIPACALAIDERAASGAGAWRRVALPAAAAVVVGVSLASSLRWAPYSYAYLNPIAGHRTDPPSWELDYWGVTAREGVTRLRALGFDEIKVEPTNDVGLPWQARPPVSGARALYLFRRGTARASSYGCEVVFTIERAGQVLGEGARCPPADGG